MKRKPNHIYIRRWICCAVLVLAISYWISILFNSAVDANRQIDEAPSAHTEDTAPPETSNISSETQQPNHDNSTPDTTSRFEDDIPFNHKLVNHNNSVSSSYYPENLINVYGIYGSADVPLKDVEVIMNEEAYLASKEMFLSAKSQGIRGTYILSAYRDYNKQSELYNEYIMDGGLYDTYSRVAKPGESEHHTGLAIDLAVIWEPNQVTSEFENTEQGQWFLANCWDYGYIVRYQSDKKDITGVVYEPWHFRYVGKEHSKQMKTLNLCLEEYIDYLYK